jgi:YebC/PmpR family DNA-binding regulatory protein
VRQAPSGALRAAACNGKNRKLFFLKSLTYARFGMSGHSKWATIKHKKGALDAKRGKIFTNLIKEITMAAKSGGDPSMNPRLRTAVAAAKAENMPQDNIKRAIQRGTGELPGVTYEEITFEGYGPGGAAVLVFTMTDNRNRTVSDIRHLFGKNGGNMGNSGSVAHLFSKKGSILVAKSAAKEDDLMNLVLENGADDLSDEGDSWEIITEPSAYETVLEAVKAAGITPEHTELGMVPANYIKLEGQPARTMVRLIEAFEEHDDVQNVYSNADIDEKDMEGE